MARKYTRDNRGRFASKGGGGATARGGRLKTASGAKRQSQTMQAKGGPKGTIGKPKGAKPAAKPVAGRFVPTTNSKGQVTGFRDRTKPAPSAAAVAQAARAQRAGRNLNAAMAREGDGPNSKASRSASVAKRARDIYSGKVDPKAKTKARLTRSTDQEALRKRIKKQKDNTTAAKPAAKAGAKGGRQITAEKALRVSQRINNVTNASSSKTGVKRLNATEVGVRAKAFATRKVGGMSGTVGMNFQQQQAAVRSGLSKPPRYSTQKPNRNKPGAYNSLGQTEQRRRLRAADSIMRSSMATAGRAGNAGAADTARRIAASAQKSMAVRLAGVAPQQRLTTKSSGRKAPDNAKTRANRLRTMQNRVQYLRQEPDSPKFQKAAQARNAALQARSAGTPGKVVFRSKNRARSRQNMQANDITARVRYDLKNAGRGKSSATGGGGRTGVRRIDTGNRQPSLLGGNATKLYKTKRVSVNRASGKSRKFYR